MKRVCSWCDNDISGLKSNAVYCSSTCRGHAHRASPCYYCGMPASEKEHITPRFVKVLNNTATVPTCVECNRLAGKVDFENPQEKRLYIKRRILKKYDKILKMPDWTPEELEELGPALKSHVAATSELKQIILERLSWELR